MPMNAFELYVLEQFLKIRNRFPIQCQESVYDHLKSIYCAWNWSLLAYEEHKYYYELQAMSEEANHEDTYCVLMPSIDEETKQIKLTPIRHSSDANGNIVSLPVGDVMYMVLCERSARDIKVMNIKEQLAIKKAHSKVTGADVPPAKQQIEVLGSPLATSSQVDKNIANIPDETLPENIIHPISDQSPCTILPDKELADLNVCHKQGEQNIEISYEISAEQTLKIDDLSECNFLEGVDVELLMEQLYSQNSDGDSGIVEQQTNTGPQEERSK